MKKNLKMVAWISGALGALLMLLGIIARLAGGILMGHMWSGYFYSSGIFLLLGIFLFVAVKVWDE